MDAPQISVKGSTVFKQVGGTRTRYSLGSHDEALETAARLEQEWEDEVAGRRANYEAQLARGVDLVVFPEDLARLEPEPQPEPEPEPEAVEDEEDLVLDVDLVWDDDTERVVVTIESNRTVDLWRSIGARTSTFTVPAGETTTRNFKAQAGDDLSIRLNGENGPEVTSTTFG